MGEEEKKPEQERMEEKKAEEPKAAAEDKKEEAGQPEKAAEEKKPEESKDGKEAKDQPPPPPPEIVLKVYMHCEGCARKVRRSLKGFQGVEDVITDCKTSKVIVKGEKADPLKVLERVQRKSHRQVELLSPIPKPPPQPEEKKPEEEKPKTEEKKEEIITVVLKVHMHCEACALEIKRRIERMKGVESAEPDLKNSQVSVKGVFDPPKLVEFVYKRTGKHAVIAKQEPEKKEEKTEEGKEKKGEEGGEKENKSNGEAEGEEKKEKKGGKPDGVEVGTVEETQTKVVELKRSEYYYYPPTYAMEMYAYPPQIFSDENPNACSVMYAYPPQIFSDENPNACSVM
ncbi:hypothetical protein L6164_014881 [Bauhinia variegata]|uniref:Uncharacterized protein n=1 Tax=Bauhinia variegata TaxID=167791 RepID=A0ACB9NIY5_BAUVA|nr:hypothetical protein L6164_014881 [Bauhinia variegata]